jgi:hypothetical protein
MNINSLHHSAVLQLHNLPINTTAREIADWFWQTIGLALQDDSIEIRNLENGLFAQALVLVGRRELADYLDRLVSEQLFHDRQIVVRPKH